MLNDKYKSVSLAGYHPKKQRRYEFTEDEKVERPNVMRPRVVDKYMKTIIGSG